MGERVSRTAFAFGHPNPSPPPPFLVFLRLYGFVVWMVFWMVWSGVGGFFALGNGGIWGRGGVGEGEDCSVGGDGDLVTGHGDKIDL